MAPANATPLLTECPRDAMQGLHEFIPTDEKVDYLNRLLRVGFDVLDFGSFVSPKAIPQLQDTKAVVPRLELSQTGTQLLAIILNERGATDALAFEEIAFLGYPYSLSETFSQRNAKRSRAQALDTLRRIAEQTHSAGRQLRVYLSMGFGNPYGDDWSEALVSDAAGEVAGLGATQIALADTAGDAGPERIRASFRRLQADHPGLAFIAHFHANPAQWRGKVEAALDSGARGFDTALRGYGGCPFAADELVGNIATENLLNVLNDRGIAPPLDEEALQAAQAKAPDIFERP